MTQEQALAEFQAMFPGNKCLKVERTRSLGFKHGYMNQFYLWDHSDYLDSHIVASSRRSWEHALAIAKSGNEDCWPVDDSPVEEEAIA